MTATLEHPVHVNDEGKLRFYSVETRGITWKAWGEMTPRERAYVRDKYPSYAAANQVPEAENRYAEEIRYFEERIAVLREYARNAPPGMARGQAAAAVRKYQDGIELRREAAAIPEGTRAWFVVMPGELRTFVPPHFGPADVEMPNKIEIQSYDHVIDTDDPLRIAWLRRLMSTLDSNVRVQETEVGKYPILDRRTNEFLMWTDFNGYHAYIESTTKRASL